MTDQLTLIADLCIDLLFTGDVRPVYGQVEQFVDDYAVELGGSAAIFATQFAKLGGKVGLLGAVGEDVFGRFLLDRLEELGVSTEHVVKTRQYKTAVGLGLAQGNDRAMLTYLGSIHAVTPELAATSGLLEQTRHLHIASYYLLEQLQPFWREVLPELKNRGVTISLDTNWDPHDHWRSVEAILPYVDLFLPNEAEAMRISQQATIEEAGRWLAHFGGLVVVKCGEEGAMVFQENEFLRYEIPQDWLKNLIIGDTTGAGDNFDAGFVYAWLQGEALGECLALATRCGVSSVRAIGGIAGQYREG